MAIKIFVVTTETYIHIKLMISEGFINNCINMFNRLGPPTKAPSQFPRMRCALDKNIFPDLWNFSCFGLRL